LEINKKAKKVIFLKIFIRKVRLINKNMENTGRNGRRLIKYMQDVLINELFNKK